MLDVETTNHECEICPRECRSQRTMMYPGMCGATDGFAYFRVAHIMSHMWEEPFISGTKGSGTVFFAGCHLGCIYCQNHKISRAYNRVGMILKPYELVSKLENIISHGVHNINLVSASHYTTQAIQLIRHLRLNGCKLPIVWNSSAYEKTETLRKLDGLIDIYLPDIKFGDNSLADRFSSVNDYVEYSLTALKEMIRQRPIQVFDQNGLMTSGVAVRHLILPGCHKDSITIIDKLSEILDHDTPLSLMSQYTPAKELINTDLAGEKQLQRRITTYEYDKVVDYALTRGFTKILGQRKDSASQNYTPDFSFFLT